MGLLILVAEDHEPSRSMLRKRFERLGHAVLEAADGAEAVAVTLNQRPDIVLMDLSLPKIDGVEAWRTIREMSDAAPLAIALTAAKIADLEALCGELGFSAYFTKPCSFRDLAAAIDELMASKNTRALAS